MTPSCCSAARAACAAICLFIAAPLAGTPTPDAVSTDSDNLVLFVGLDVLVKHVRGEGRVEDYNKQSMLLETTTGPATVRTSDVETIRAVRDPKITAARVMIDRVNAERTYSSSTDPEMEALRQQITMMDHQSAMQDRIDSSQRDLANAAAAAAQLPQEFKDAAIKEAQRRADVVTREARQANIDPVDVRKTVLDDATDAFDVLHVTFEIASPVDIYGAYALLLTAIRAPGSPAASPRYTLAELPPLGRQPRKVRLTQPNLPPGFVLLDSEIHIYAAGQEFASNLSPRRTTISRSEAHTFLTLQREIKLEGGSAPAEVAKALLTPEIRTAISPGQRSRTAKVGINTDGIVTSVALDTAGSPEIDAPIEAAIRKTLFFPTLENGRPVASTLTFSLSEWRS